MLLLDCSSSLYMRLKMLSPSEEYMFQIIPIHKKIVFEKTPHFGLNLSFIAYLEYHLEHHQYLAFQYHP